MNIPQAANRVVGDVRHLLCADARIVGLELDDGGIASQPH